MNILWWMLLVAVNPVTKFFDEKRREKFMFNIIQLWGDIMLCGRMFLKESVK